MNYICITMKIICQKIVFVCFLLVSASLQTNAGIRDISGIAFRGNDYDVDSRTSLRIPEQSHLSWNGDKMTLEFDLKVSRHGDHFGYVCSIGIGAGEIVSLFLTNPKNGSPYLCAVDDSGQLCPIRDGGQPIDIYEWNRISLEFASGSDSIVVSENGQTMFAKKRERGNIPLTIIFGKGYLSGKSCIDVAPMEIRDIRLTLGDSNVYLFPLDKSGTDSVISDTEGRLAIRLENHEWIIDRHSRWKLVRSISHGQKAYPVAAYGSSNLYLVTGDRVVKVDLVKQRVSEFKYREGFPDMNRLSNNFMVLGPRQNERLVYYSIDGTDSSSADISRFDSETGSWIPPISPRRLSSYINHSRYVTDNDSTVVQMFGYGYHAYKNDFYRIRLSDGMTGTEKSVLCDVAPRYLCAAGRMDDRHVILYGGIGNMYGDQEFGTRMFDDMYVLDTMTDSLTCIRKNSGQQESMVAVDNLLYDAESNSVTGLFFTPFRANTGLTLRRIDIESGEMGILSDSIPYMFSDVNSSAMLIHLPQTDMLYAVTVRRNPEDQGGYTTDIYTLQLPVLPIVSETDARISGNMFSKQWIWIGAAILLLAGTTGLYVRKRRHRAAIPDAVMKSLTPVETADTSDCGATGMVNEDPEPVIRYEAPMSPGISLLGGFRVVDGKGENITGSFTPILRHMLILVILYTERNGEGISNTLLKDCLWPDKSDESFLNNRRVNMRKLRVLLPEIGELRLGVSHGNWSLETADCQLVDYFAVMSAARAITEKGYGTGYRRVRRLLDYISRGPLLPECQYEWLDAFKSRYSDMIIQLLHTILDDNLLKHDPELALRVSDCILLFDSIDEDAVRAKCRILLQANRVGTASKAFDRFVREYHTLMNEPFGRNFNEFIE